MQWYTKESFYFPGTANEEQGAVKPSLAFQHLPNPKNLGEKEEEEEEEEEENPLGAAQDILENFCDFSLDWKDPSPHVSNSEPERAPPS